MGCVDNTEHEKSGPGGERAACGGGKRMPTISERGE